MSPGLCKQNIQLILDQLHNDFSQMHIENLLLALNELSGHYLLTGQTEDHENLYRLAKQISPGRQELQNKEIIQEIELILRSKKSEKTMKPNPIQTQVVQAHSETSLKSPPVIDDSNASIRVPVQVLDRLMNLMGEIVLVRNQVLQFANNTDSIEFLNLSKKLNSVTSELQSEVMRTRMQPIDLVFSKFNRLVRDLSKELNKNIRLSLTGGETELDKTLIEAIKDPLVHIVRNACDHGIESPADRLAQNKKSEGHIHIKACHENGQILIEITDDGKGLDKKKLIQKAIEKNIVSASAAELLTEQEAFNLIFKPGFSTASSVTNISGRGVGMDVVKSNVEKIGGRVDITSVSGASMTLTMRIPLTLAILPALTVKSGQNMFVIPQSKLVELVKINSEDHGSAQIEFVHNAPVLRLRENLLQLVSLKSLLHENESDHKTNFEQVQIAVLNSEGKEFGLVVDQVYDSAEIVVKPLSRMLKSTSLFSGATILGDGQISLILDVNSIIERIKLKSLTNQTSKHEKNEKINSSDYQEFIICSTHEIEKVILPLSLVYRLEEFKTSQIKMAGDQAVVDYRNEIMPLIPLNKFLGNDEEEFLKLNIEIHKVVVVKIQNKLLGIVVEKILDVLKTDGKIEELALAQPGYLGSLVSEKTMYLVLDVFGCAEKILNKNNPSEAENKITKNHRVLCIDDSPFFRNYLKRTLDPYCHSIVLANNGQEGLERALSEEFDVIFCDIEMPVMTGLEFIAAFKATSFGNKTKVVALTTRFSGEDVEKGLKFGFSDYLEKAKIDEIITSLKIHSQKSPKKSDKNYSGKAA